MKDGLDIKQKTLKLSVLFLKKTALLSALSCRFVKLTGKHKDRIHPKHLVDVRKPWYLPYIKARDIVLDVGCDNGQQSIKVAKKCRKVHGFDYNSKSLNLAEKEKKRLKVKNVSFKFGDAEKIFPYKNNIFDTVLFLDVLEYLNDRKSPLKEIFRVLKNKGLLFVSVPNSDTSWKNLQKSLGISYFCDPDHKVEYTKDEIINALENSGFEIIEIFSVTYDTPLVGFIDLIGGISLKLYTFLSIWRRKNALKNPGESIGLEVLCRKP